MTPLSELDRLFPAIPKPDPLGCQCSMRIRLVGDGCQYCNPDYANEVDADETNHGPCAQGDCSDE